MVQDKVLPDTECQLERMPSQAQLLRYEANILLKLGKLSQARVAAIASFELVKGGNDLTEIGASRSLMAQVAWDLGHQHAARSMATKAAHELNKGGNYKEILRHTIFFAFVEAHFDPRHAQIIANYGMQLCRQGYGNETVQLRLKAVRDNTQDLQALNSALSELDQSPIS